MTNSIGNKTCHIIKKNKAGLCYYHKPSTHIPISAMLSTLLLDINKTLDKQHNNISLSFISIRLNFCLKKLVSPCEMP